MQTNTIITCLVWGGIMLGHTRAAAPNAVEPLLTHSENASQIHEKIRAGYPSIKDMIVYSMLPDEWSTFAARLKENYGVGETDFFWLWQPMDKSQKGLELLLFNNNTLSFTRPDVPIILGTASDDPADATFTFTPKQDVEKSDTEECLGSQQVSSEFVEAVQNTYKVLKARRKSSAVSMGDNWINSAYDSMSFHGIKMLGDYNSNCMILQSPDYFLDQYFQLMHGIYMAAVLGYLNTDAQLWFMMQMQDLAQQRKMRVDESCFRGPDPEKRSPVLKPASLDADALAKEYFPQFQGEWSLILLNTKNGTILGADIGSRGILQVEANLFSPEATAKTIPEAYLDLRQKYHQPAISPIHYMRTESRLVSTDCNYLIFPDKEWSAMLRQALSVTYADIRQSPEAGNLRVWARKGATGEWLNAGTQSDTIYLLYVCGPYHLSDPSFILDREFYHDIKQEFIEYCQSIINKK